MFPYVSKDTERRSYRPAGSTILAYCALAMTFSPPWANAQPLAKVKGAEAAVAQPARLWHEQDTASLDLYWGPGGKENQPKGPFRFQKEDLDGANPKIEVEDAAGVKWKVKMGIEAQPETAASRITWAAGYYVCEEYFVPEIRIEGLPLKLHRGQKLVEPGGVVRNVRLKKDPAHTKKTGTWKWKREEVAGTREWNGLRVLMAVLNNWDLKDVNNSVFENGSERLYVVSDLGVSFGSAGRTWPNERSRGNLESYERSGFVRRVSAEFVDFQTPARPQWVFLINPREYISRVRMERLGKGVPRADARWLGQQLARLSHAQILDAFRAAGYSGAEMEAFAKLVERRIDTLNKL